MSDEAAALPSFSRRSVGLLQRNGVIAFLVLLAVILLLVAISPHGVSYFDISTISASGTTLALAGIGETIVILGGGLDLSLGAVISLVNVVLVTTLGSSELGVVPYTALAAAIAIGIGAAVGAVNGLLVSYLRLPSIIVTLGTMFVVQGLALLILKSPEGSVSGDFANLLVGDAIPDVLPSPILIIVLAVLAWLYLKRLRFGVALYAIGSDAAAARASRVNVQARSLPLIHGGRRIFRRCRLVHHRQCRIRRPPHRHAFSAEGVCRGRSRRHVDRRRARRRGRYGIRRADTDHRHRHLSCHGRPDLLRADCRRRDSSHRGAGAWNAM